MDNKVLDIRQSHISLGGHQGPEATIYKRDYTPKDANK